MCLPVIAVRFPIRIEFPDYDEAELVQIATKMFDSKGFTLSDAALAELPGKLLSFKAREVGPSGNGRMVRNFVENVLRNQSARVASYDASRDELIEVRPEDLMKFGIIPEFNLFCGQNTAVTRRIGDSITLFRKLQPFFRCPAG